MAPALPGAKTRKRATSGSNSEAVPALLSITVQPVTAAPTPVTPLSAIPSLPRGLTKLTGRALRFLIGAFPVPPYLLPVYQAASIEYGVPWQVLAAINQIETNFGRDLAVSSAGAEGWMQFLPSTWARFGLALDGGKADPYDPVDAIFAAARYLRVAGAGSNLSRAIFAYNHANWYVNSVELRAQLLQILPQGIVEGLMGLMQASFPVAGHLGRNATTAPKLVRAGGQPAAVITVPADAPVIAGADGRVIAIGHSRTLGRYVTIEDSYGDRFTYAHLGKLATLYPVLRPRAESARQLARQLGLRLETVRRLPAATRLALAASAGARSVGRNVTSGRSAGRAATGSRSSGGAGTGRRSGRNGRGTAGLHAGRGAGVSARASSAAVLQARPLVKERLFADPARPGSYAAGGRLQLQLRVRSYLRTAGIQIIVGRSTDIYSLPLRLRGRRFAVAPLHVGAIVAAGTILGFTSGRRGETSKLLLEVTPPGARHPIDPRSVISGWELLGRLTHGRRAFGRQAPAGAFDVRNASLGQLVMSSSRTLASSVLANRQVHTDACYRSAIAGGRVDRRVLAAISYLAYSGLAPTVTGAGCESSGTSGASFEITALEGTPVLGHQQAGGMVDLAIRQLLALQGMLRPSQIISLRSYPWESATLALPDHPADVEVQFARGGSTGRLATSQWSRLARRLVQLAGSG